MTYRKTAYDTIACSGAMISKIIEPITLSDWKTNSSYCGIGEINGMCSQDRIPSFFHPIYIERLKNIFVDVRPYVGFDKFTQEVFIKNQTGYKLTCLRGALNKIWVIEKPAYLRDISSFPMAAYVAWLSENIARRFALDGAAQYQLSILTAIFYNSHFTDDKDLSSTDKQHLASYLSRQLKLSGEDVYNVLEQYSVIHSIDEYCEAARVITGSVSLQQLNKGTLISVINNTFFGVNASENAAVAIEHPPTWMGILLDAIQNQAFYKKTIIGGIINRKQFDDSRTSFLRSVVSMLSHFE